jgi:hypothetical protein
MAVTDEYVVQFLLNATQASGEGIAWQPGEAGGYGAEVNGVRITLFQAHSMGWSGLCISLMRGADVAQIEEPRPASMFGRKYGSEDERQLAATMQELGGAISRQCHAREARAWQLREKIRETLYRQVLFGQP